MRQGIRRTSLAALALATGFWPAAMVQAQAKIERVRLSPTDRVEDAYPEDRDIQVPTGSSTLYVIVDYQGASRAKVGVEVVAPGKITLFEKSTTVSGDGVTTIQVTGAQVFQELARQTMALADDVEALAADAQRDSRSAYEFLSQAAGVVTTQLPQAVDLLERVPLDGGLLAERQNVEAALRTLEDTAGDVETGMTDERVEQVAGEMIDQARDLADAAESLKDQATGASTLPLPESGADRNGAFDVTVRVGTYAAASTQFWVTSADVPAATSTATGRGTSAPTDTAATATSRAAQGGATATRAPGGSNGAPGGDGSAARTQVPTSAAVVRSAPPGGAAARMTAAAGAADGSAPDAATPDVVALADTGAPTPADAALGGAEEPAAVPTWTVPAALGAAAGTAESGDSDARDSAAGGASGPNLAVFGIGVMVLIAVAMWLRRRM